MRVIGVIDLKAATAVHAGTLHLAGTECIVGYSEYGTMDDVGQHAALWKWKSGAVSAASDLHLLAAAAAWELEEATGVPVLTILNTVIWRGLHELRHPGGVQGYGRLLERAS